MSRKNLDTLKNCIIDTNCKLVEWKFDNLNQAYKRLIDVCTNLPRTKVIEETDNYWHGVCRSLIFRFPDDLEVLKIPRKGIIQLKSSSRVGVSDLGVNSRRINTIYKNLTNNNKP